jgi:SpoVK/Ycf46/Vps4 family AAA+-type ATPase
MIDSPLTETFAVFLRSLEYFEGLLFLTTNRLSIFDEAFKSRIHVVINIDSLTSESRKQIWDNFLRPIIPDVDIHLDELAAKDINGREIRNLISMAVGIAKHRGDQLEIKHLREVIALQR